LALIQKLLDATIVKNQESIVLDFFAGSGTTAHAISEINKKKDGKINFIICTNNLQDEKIIDKFTLPRMKNNNIQISYYKTSLLPHNSKVNDDDRINLTDRVGELVGLKESTLETMEINSYYHILNNKSKTKCTLIYFNEDLYK
jgi:adenine-specific DNA-methyltransferase